MTMTDDELNEAVQHTLGSSDILSPRERADEAVALIGRHVAGQASGLLRPLIWGLTAVKREPQPRRWWRR